MTLKSILLSVLGRKTLKRIVDDHEIDDVDRRSVEAMRAALSRLRQLTAEDVLAYMRKDEVQAACTAVGVSSEGRRDQLARRLRSQLVSSIQQARTAGLEDGTRIKPRKKGWVVIDRHGFFLMTIQTISSIRSLPNRDLPSPTTSGGRRRQI